MPDLKSNDKSNENPVEPPSDMTRVNKRAQASQKPSTTTRSKSSKSAQSKMVTAIKNRAETKKPADPDKGELFENRTRLETSSRFEQRLIPLIFWSSLIILGFFFLWLLQKILLPFALGATLAYFLNPVVNRITHERVSRGIVSLVLVIVLFAFLILFATSLLPWVAQQGLIFFENLPVYSERLLDNFDKFLIVIQQQFLGSGIFSNDNVQTLQLGLHEKLRSNIFTIGEVIKQIIEKSFVVVNLVLMVIITPIVTFYFLRDWELLMQRIDNWLPRDHLEIVREKAREIDRVLRNFVRGQALVSSTMGLYYGIALLIVGGKVGLLIGIITGILSFIPFLGFFIGFVAALSMVLVENNGWEGPVIVVAIFSFGSIFETYYLQPKFVGSRIGLHPVWMIFSLLSASALFGIVGVLVAIPMAAVLGVLLRLAVEGYLGSKLYNNADHAKR